MSANDKKRYPIGTFEYGKTYSLADTRKHIRTLARFPKELKKALKKLDNDEYDQAYRKAGWTVRQVVHHLADSHINAYIRMKLAVTEPTPVIKPYEEASWAETEDGKFGPIRLSLKLLAALHRRWILFLESLSDEDLEASYFHPEMQRVIPLQEAIALYAWHSMHHLGHIQLVSKGIQNNDSEEAAVEKPEPIIVSEHKKRGPKPKPAAAPAAAERTKPGPKPKAATPAAVSAEPKKRGPKPKIAAAGATAAAPKKRGPKPKAVAPIAAAPAAKRGRKPRATEVQSVVTAPAVQEEMSDYMKLVNAVISGAQSLPERKKRGPKGKASSVTTTAEPKKRGPKPKVAAAGATTAEPKKRGPKPKIAAAGATTAEPKKRGPKPKIAAAGATTAEPKKRGPKPKIAAAGATTAEPKKRGPKPKIAAAGATTAEPKKRGPKPKVAAAGATTAEPKKRGPKPKVAAPAKKGSEEPKRRGMSPEHMAKIREARMASLAAKKAGAPVVSKPVAEPKKRGPKPKAAAPATSGTEEPKRRGMSPEHMAKIREARMAKLAAKKAEEKK